jgi:hypothetical protein
MPITTKLGSTSPLTPEELERSVEAKKRGLFADVKPADLFSAQSDGMLAERVRRQHPSRYQALKLEWRYETKELRRPDYE